MAADINSSYLVEKAQDYAKLSAVAYAKSWVINKEGKLEPSDSNLKAYWNELYGKGYRFVDQSSTNDASGFSATIFELDGYKILSVAGTSIFDPGDMSANSDIVAGRLPHEQFESLVKYISAQNLTNFDVTGHSLGGFLAQAAKAAFPVLAQNAYTYNAPGAKGLVQYAWFKIDPRDDKVVILLPGIKADPASVDIDLLVSLGYAFKWERSTYDAYCRLFQNQSSTTLEDRIYNISEGNKGRPSIYQLTHPDPGGIITPCPANPVSMQQAPSIMS